MKENNLEDDDRFLFYMESDLDKIRGTRKLAYLPKKQHAHLLVLILQNTIFCSRE